METTFSRWLRGRGESAYAYHRRSGHRYVAVCRLAGLGVLDGKGERAKPYNFSYSLLASVATDTGIAIETLGEEARRASARPTMPRRYRRKAPAEDAAAAE